MDKCNLIDVYFKLFISDNKWQHYGCICVISSYHIVNILQRKIQVYDQTDNFLMHANVVRWNILQLKQKLQFYDSIRSSAKGVLLKYFL
jgi:hypothetical protein